ncbi:MAG: hypothetical protein IKE23_04495 [Exiguobacterium sp.]|nr:hypothetical protein [Exiguobacterium sp.]
MTILPVDEINALEDRLKVHFENGGKGRIKSRQDCEDIIDELLDLYLLSYARGVEATNTELSTKNLPQSDSAQAAVDKAIAGETWRQRVWAYYEDGGSLYDITRIAETDATRIYNEGALDAVRANGVEDITTKRWITMMDDRVRDTHSYLENMVVPFDRDFWTYDGDHAPAPGMFELPQNNINCRCVIEIKRG